MARGQTHSALSAAKRTERVTIHIDDQTAEALRRVIEKRSKEAGRGARITASSYLEAVLLEHLATCR